MHPEGVPEKGVSAAIQDGKFALKAVPVGPATVTVESYGVTAQEAAKPLAKGVSIPREMAVRAKAAKRLPVPERFASVEQSGVTCEVVRGPQPKDFELK